jgi:tRNA(Ile)-lysidine synthetase-like protein
VVLLAALCKSRSKKTQLRAVHVHHGLHPNADAWSEHCSALAAKLRVPLTTLKVKVVTGQGASVEAAAREARYQALAGALEEGEVLLTAHHEDDQLETVLLQLMRGAGVAGLAAMPAVAQFGRGILARPLLTSTRADLEAWARANELTWIEDDTNANEQFDRNYLRRQVLPLIRARWPGASRAVSRSARHAAEAKGLLDALALADVERASNGAALSVQHLRALAPDRRRNAVRYWIARAGHPLPDAARLEEITRTLLDARPDANPFVEWPGVRAQRHAGHLTLEPAEKKVVGPTARAKERALAPPQREARAAGAAAKSRRASRAKSDAASTLTGVAADAAQSEKSARAGAPAAADAPSTVAQTRGARATSNSVDSAEAHAPRAERKQDSARPDAATKFSTHLKKNAALSASAVSNEGTAWNWRAFPTLLLVAPKGTLSLKPDPHGPLDLSKLPETLRIKTRGGGERLRPNPGARTKTLKSLLQEARIPLSERANLPLIYAGEQLIAAGDRWLDASVQATGSGTSSRARLRWTR